MSGILENFWPTLTVAAWLGFITVIAGPLAGFLAGITGLFVALIALWEIGRPE